jgi:hypothetical protein
LNLFFTLTSPVLELIAWPYIVKVFVVRPKGFA